MTKILIVDDNVNFRRTLADVINLEGFQTIIEERAEEAVKLTEAGDIDVALVDVRLKDKEGLWVIREIRKQSPGTECILFTGFVFKVEDADALGAFAFFRKPLDFAQVLLAIHRAVEKKTAISRLEESEARFRRLYENSPGPYQSMDIHGNLIEVNNAWLQELGYAREEVIGKPFADFLAEDNREIYRERFIQFKKEGCTSENTLTLIKKDGSSLIAAFEGRIEFDADKKFQRTHCIFFNITEREQARAELAAFTERINGIYSAAPVGIGLIKDRFFLDVNQCACEITGYTREELIGYSTRKLYDSEEDFDFIGEERERQYKKNNSFHVESQFLRKDGRRIQVLLRGSPLDGRDYKNGTVFAFQDITDQKRAAKDLKESEERFSLAFNTSPNAITITHPKDGRFLDVNPAFTDLTGYTREEAINGPIDFINPWVSHEDRESVLQQLKEGKKVSNQEIQFRGKDGRILTALYSAEILALNNEQFVFSSASDITQLKIAESALVNKTRQITMINEMGQALAQTKDLASVYRLAGEYVPKLADAPMFCVSLIDEKKQALVAQYLLVEGSAQDAGQLPQLPLNKRKKSGRSGAINTQKPMIVHDLPGEIARAKTAMMVGDEAAPETALYVPMVVEGSVIGLLEVQSYLENAYSAADAEMLGTAANHVALAVANSRQFKDLQTQSAALNAAGNGIVITDAEGLIEWINPAFSAMTGFEAEECIGKNPRDCINSGVTPDATFKDLWTTIKAGKVWRGTLINRRKDGSLYSEEQTITPMKDADGSIFKFIAINQDVTEKEQRQREMTILTNISTALRKAITKTEMVTTLLDELISQMNIQAATLDILDETTGELTVEQGRGVWEVTTGNRIPAGQGLSAGVLKTGKPYLSNHADDDPMLFRPEVFGKCHAAAGVLMEVLDRRIGLIWIGSERNLDDNDLRTLTAIADMAANALQRVLMYEQTLRRVEQLNSLRTIDQAIASSLDLRVTLDVIIKQAANLFEVDAINVLTYDPNNLMLDYAAGCGFKHLNKDDFQVRIGSGLAGKVAHERQALKINDIDSYRSDIVRKELLEKEGFKAYHALPLLAKGEIKGVLEAYHRHPFSADREWLEMFERLAAQFAIAINTSEMFFGMQMMNANLIIAYDETIEGWAAALDLRDHDTEYHSRRVTDVVLQMARKLGMSNEAIAHMRRGALLHDIGKIVIPDAILKKPGPLDDNEWTMMRDHPLIARELLSRIKFLKPALDIPYCHHEKWDGTGYPQGLKGEEIPLAARLFAVVDVFDALTSNRSYRPPWKEKDEINYLKEQSGKHFDPQAVELFLEIRT